NDGRPPPPGPGGAAVPARLSPRPSRRARSDSDPASTPRRADDGEPAGELNAPGALLSSGWIRLAASRSGTPLATRPGSGLSGRVARRVVTKRGAQRSARPVG